MSYTYAQAKQQENKNSVVESQSIAKDNFVPNSVFLSQMESGQPSAEAAEPSVVMREKMEGAFDTDRKARGESVVKENGGAVAPLSTASAASASGPMQAKSGKKKKKRKKKAPQDLNAGFYIAGHKHKRYGGIEED